MTERWRCGDKFADRMRGIVPAEVEVSTVPCPDGTAPAQLTAPAAGARREALAASLARTQPPLTGNPIRAIRGGLLPGSPRPGAPATDGCYGWALASPILDDGRPVDTGDQAREPLVIEAWKERQFRPGPLDDAVVLTFGPFEYARFYLWVPTRFLYAATVVVCASDANDTIYDSHVVTGADAVPPVTLPASWLDPASPWYRDVTALEELAAMAVKNDYTPVFVEVKGAPGADRVQIGCPPPSRQIRREISLRPFYVGGIEALKSSELTRSDYDTTEQVRKQQVLSDALGLNSSDNALLAPGQQYQVSVTWDASRERRAQGQPPSDQQSVTGQVQSFWFATDAQPPARLDPWVLVALPGEGEPHFFGSETVRVVFATSDIGDLYAAYGQKLQARLRPSSYVPVSGPPGVPHPYPLSPANLQPLPAAILSPWENSVQSSGLGQPALRERQRRADQAHVGRRSRSRLTCSPTTCSTSRCSTRGRRRLGRDTGVARLVLDRRVPDRADFATSFQTSKVDSSRRARRRRRQAAGDRARVFAGAIRRAPNSTARSAERACPRCRAEDARRHRLLGSRIAAPQPAALLIDASEPMWRDRPIPTAVTDRRRCRPSATSSSRSPGWTSSSRPAATTSWITSSARQAASVPWSRSSRAARKAHHARAAPHRAYRAYLDGPGATDHFYPVLDLTLSAAPWEEVD